MLGYFPILTVAALLLVNTGCDSPPGASVPPAPRSEIDDLGALIERLMREGRVPGAAFALIRDGAIIGERGLGLEDAAAGTPVTPETVFEAASLSKPMLAYLVLKMAERGEIDLDRPLAETLPHPDLDDPRRGALTARQVLSHTTGLPNWRPGRWTDDPSPLLLGFDPGSRFSYSGEGFEYLQWVVEHLTGASLEELARREIFSPLGMSHSTFQYAASQPSATPHDVLGEITEKRTPEASAAGSLHTTAGDYARFVAEMLRPQHLGDAFATEMLAPQVEIEDGPGVAWSLGWGLEPESDGFWHWGDNGNFRCFAMASRSRGDGLVLFTNSRNGFAIAEDIFAQGLSAGGPAFAWIDYDRYDSPGFQIQGRLLRAAVDGGAEATAAALAELESTRGQDLTEDLVNRMGYSLLGRKQAESAVTVLQWNADKYPDAWNVYDSLGEALARSGDVAAGIENYEKSLELNPENANAVAMLMKLREGGNL